MYAAHVSPSISQTRNIPSAIRSAAFSSYVCLSCRIQLQPPPQPRQQRRWKHTRVVLDQSRDRGREGKVNDDSGGSVEKDGREDPIGNTNAVRSGLQKYVPFAQSPHDESPFADSANPVSRANESWKTRRNGHARGHPKILQSRRREDFPHLVSSERQKRHDATVGALFDAHVRANIQNGGKENFSRKPNVDVSPLCGDDLLTNGSAKTHPVDRSVGLGTMHQSSVLAGQETGPPFKPVSTAAMTTARQTMDTTTRRHARGYHTSSVRSTPSPATATVDASLPPTMLKNMGPKNTTSMNGIRAQLRKWQEVNGDKDIAQDNINLDEDLDYDGSVKNLTRLPDDKAVRENEDDDEVEREARSHFMQPPVEDSGAIEHNPRFLKMGDLVEIESDRGEMESLVAVFIQRIGGLAQFYTVHGRWLHAPEKQIQYSIPGWVSEGLVRPMLAHLPTLQDVGDDINILLHEAYVRDLSVPREVSAPLVTRMVQFNNESHEIYRKNASTLDNAHALLAHETDLRYGSLRSTATTLLKTPADKLPVTALFAVRRALKHAGFGFNVDRRSHRLTGYLQIRSKQTVQMVDQVRKWVRAWQDDLAAKATMNAKQAARHRPSRDAQFVYDFLEKAVAIVLKSRKNRDPTPFGSVGPSKIQLPITNTSDSVRITKDEQFTEHEREIVRFLELWCLSNQFLGLPRIEALPPLILQGTGLYENYILNSGTATVFLQELGTILPYENRVRFDQHLLLPNSEHSKPLQDLMVRLISMQRNHNFVDAMKDLRHDWKDLRVFCIDDADAQEIDDGVSIEPVLGPSATRGDGRLETATAYWIHTHVANPTAFFSREHPLAKMARHMGESFYMPERTYPMLPRWATQRHFSLGKDRPCLTFSAKLDLEGRVLEHKITPGIIRNAINLTHDEILPLLGQTDTRDPQSVFTVGGTPPPPPPRERVSMISNVTSGHVQDLKTLCFLADKRKAARQAAGGLFFHYDKPEVQVWQNHKAPGLAWDNPHRKGARHVEGDPVIQLKTRPVTNWFVANDGGVDVMVQELMLLACEVAARWCDARQIPAIFRGSVSRPDKLDSATYFKEFLEPLARKSPDSSYPMHLGIGYLATFGQTGLAQKPFKHRPLGMEYYGKVTSPLRRYGDMILHWQIEAALRHEAATGKSLRTSDPQADRRFLPFSPAMLDTIMVGLPPRELMIMRAKEYALRYWQNLLVFRMFHFPGHLPSDSKMPPRLTAYVEHARPTGSRSMNILCQIVELNLSATMLRPGPKFGNAMEDVMDGDVWEVEIDQVDAFRRTSFFRPVRLLERAQV